MATVNLGHVVGPGVPTGGTAGQVLKKASSTNFDAAWASLGDLPEIEAALADIADEYSSSTVYSAGDYCIYNGQLYRHNSWGADTPAAESWTAAHWMAVTVMDELDAETTARAAADTAHDTQISCLQGEIGYVVDGKQCANAVSVGKYVIVKNSSITGVTDGLYTAAKAITANTNIDSTYLTAVSAGGVANSLNDSIANKTESFGSKTIAGMQTAIEGKLASLADGESFSFKVTLTDTSSVFASATSHTGTAVRSAASRVNVYLQESGQTAHRAYCGTLTSNGWSWGEVAWADSITNNDYASSGLTPTGCSIILGGYHKIGKLVIINIRINKTSASGVSISGFPSPAIANSNSFVNVSGYNSSNEKVVFGYLSQYGSLNISSGCADTGNVILSAMYMCA